MSQRDQVTLDRIELLHPLLRDEALKIYQKCCSVLTGRATVRFTYTTRSFKEQNLLFAQGRTKPGKIVTKAKAGFSFHNYGLAIDICLIIDGKEASWNDLKDFDYDGIADWMEIVAIFKEFGWEWGGNFKSILDKPHFQKTFGYKVEKLLAFYNAGQVDINGFVKIAA
ncbi:M15 family metallopeptidase [Aquirufa nivalisilvae]